MYTPPDWADISKMLVAAGERKDEEVPGILCSAGKRMRAYPGGEREQDTKALFTIHYK